MREALRGYAAAVLDDLVASSTAPERPADAGMLAAAVKEVAGELGVLLRALESSTELWRVMCQVGYPVEVRVGVLCDLLRAGARAETSRLAEIAVRRERASDLVPAMVGLVERLDAEAGRISQSVVSPVAGAAAMAGVAAEPLASRAGSRERLSGYLVGLFDSVGSAEGGSQLEELEDELFRFARVIESDTSLRALLTDRDAPVSARLGVVSDLLTGRASRSGSRMVAYAVRAGRARELVASLDWLAAQVALERGRRLARVRSAIDLDPQQHREMSLALSARVGAPVELQVEVDQALVGGAVALVGDMVVDGSVRRRLGQLEDTLKRGGEIGAVVSRIATGGDPPFSATGGEPTDQPARGAATGSQARPGQ